MVVWVFPYHFFDELSSDQIVLGSAGNDLHIILLAIETLIEMSKSGSSPGNY